MYYFLIRSDKIVFVVLGCGDGAVVRALTSDLPPMWPRFDSEIRRQMWVEFVGSLLRGPFLESPETFQAHFGWHNSLCIFIAKASRGTKTLHLF